MTDILKPCPWCGHAAFVKVTEVPNTNHGGTWWVAGCKGCGVSFPLNFQNDAAVREWNDRLVPPPHSAGVVVTDITDEMDRLIHDGALNEHALRSLLRDQLGRLTAALVAALGGEGDGWIACSERMPDEGVDVIVAGRPVRDGSGLIISMAYWRWHDPNTMRWHGLNHGSHSPSFWRPLPKGPQ